MNKYIEMKFLTRVLINDTKKKTCKKIIMSIVYVFKNTQVQK